MSSGIQLLILIVIIGVFWLLLMRPARNQRRQMHQLQNDLAVGDRVVISAGIFGTVQSVEDGKVELEIAPGTVVTVTSQVVVRRVEEENEDEDADQVDPDEASSGESEAAQHTDPAGEGPADQPVVKPTADEER
ncbi:MAG: preprotein translocase subunit YajC [Marmoricola sp.]